MQCTDTVFSRCRPSLKTVANGLIDVKGREIEKCVPTTGERILFTFIVLVYCVTTIHAYEALDCALAECASLPYDKIRPYASS